MLFQCHLFLLHLFYAFLFSLSLSVSRPPPLSLSLSFCLSVDFSLFLALPYVRSPCSICFFLFLLLSSLLSLSSPISLSFAFRSCSHSFPSPLCFIVLSLFFPFPISTNIPFSQNSQERLYSVNCSK